jgi:iron complex transport system permease protein
LKPFGYEGNWSTLDMSVVLGLRLPRIIGAILVGSCLAISGAAYQSTFQNPLVSPDLLGVSSGACVGAALAILMHLPSFMIMVMAFVTAVLTVAATLAIPKILRSESNIMLVLSGIVVGGVTGSIMGIIKYVADPESELPQITYWTMGSLDNVDLTVVGICIVPILICTVIMLRMSWWIDIISLGEKDAKTLGANVNRIRLITIACSTLLTAISVCMCGTIGWIGLVVPHFARMFVGPDNTKLMPTSALLGAIFLMVVDTLARNVAVVEVPLGIITGLVGAPFYAWLLYKQRMTLH